MRRRDERGSIAPAVPILAFVLLLLGGLGIDASRVLNARGAAVAFAEEAARAGAEAIDVEAEGLALDEPLARTRVASYCASVVSAGQVDDCHFVRLDEVGDGDRRRLVVRVRVDTTIKASLLGLIGVRTLHAGGEGRARPFEGLDDPFGQYDDPRPPQPPPSDYEETPGPAPSEAPPSPTATGTSAPAPSSSAPATATASGAAP